MKRLNKKGFTLIELLAVIVIMGILMVVAIPAITRTINNSRKDTFASTAKSYITSAQTLWAAEGIKCNGVVSTSLGDGDYYIEVSQDAGLLDKGGTSPWGNAEIKGYIKVNVDDGATTYSAALSDNTHGFTEKAETAIDRTAVEISGVTYPEFTADADHTCAVTGDM